MNIVDWFMLGIGIAVALWWWRFIVAWITFDESNEFDPFFLYSERRPRQEFRNGHLPACLLGGTLLFILSPLWLPIYLPYGLLNNRCGTIRNGYLKMLGGGK